MRRGFVSARQCQKQKVAMYLHAHMGATLYTLQSLLPGIIPAHLLLAVSEAASLLL